MACKMFSIVNNIDAIVLKTALGRVVFHRVKLVIPFENSVIRWGKLLPSSGSALPMVSESL